MNNGKIIIKEAPEQRIIPVKKILKGKRRKGKEK